MRCRICDSEKDHAEYKVKEMMFGLREEFAYFKCAYCGCLQIKGIPSDMSGYYPSDYYSLDIRLGKFENPISCIARRIRNRYAVFNKGIIGKFLYGRIPHQALRSLSPLKLRKDMRILDIGCGSGNALYSLKEFGFNNLLGVDPNIEKDLIYPNGLTILKKQIHEIDGKFDLVMFHHSLEHLEHQVESLRAANRLMHPDGLLIVRIPLADSWAWETYGTSWFQIDAPRHFFLHSRTSFGIVAQKAGLKIKEVIYDSVESQFWASEQYKKDIPLYAANSFFTNPSKSIFTKQQIRTFKLKTEFLNSEQRGDQAVFYLEKAPKEIT